MKDFANSILSLPRYSKRAIAIITDLGLCFICTWIAFIIRLEEIIFFKDFNYYSAFISIIMLIPILWLFGSYRTIFRFAGLSIIFNVSISILIYGFLYFLVIGFMELRSSKIYWHSSANVNVLPIMSTRLGIKYLLAFNINNNINKKNILVYGLAMLEDN